MIKLLEENTSSKFFDIGLGNILLEMSPQVRGTQAKFFKWDYSSQGKNIVFISLILYLYKMSVV